MMIDWIAYNLTSDATGKPYSPFASTRYRVIIPALELKRTGHTVNLISIGKDDNAADLLPRFTAQTVIFSKFITVKLSSYRKLHALTIDIMERLKAQGKTVAVDINDNHFANPKLGPYFKDLVRRANLVVSSTPELADIIRPHTDAFIPIVTDPYEGPHGTPAFTPPKAYEILKLAWFGHQSNWPTLKDSLHQLMTLNHPFIQLEIVTAPITEITAFCQVFNDQNPPGFSLIFAPWSVESTWQAIARSHLVIIPTHPADPHKSTKSPNRVVETLRAGRLAVVNPLPAYSTLKDFCLINDSLEHGINSALANPADMLHRISRGQHHINYYHSRASVAQQWLSALNTTESSDPAAKTTLAASLVAP